MAPRVQAPLDRPPVTILRAATEPFPQHGVLGAIRSLGRWGIPVTLVSPSPDRGIAAASRFVTRRWAWGPDAPDAVGALQGLGRIQGRSVLLATDDASAAFVQAHASDLTGGYLFPVLPEGLVPRLLDKGELARIASAAGVRVPATRTVLTAEELDAALGSLGLPLVIKAPPGPREGRSVTVARTRAEVHAWLARAGRLVVQEHVAGSPRQANWIYDAYLDRSGICRFWATGRKLAQHPPYAGTATQAVAERNDELAAIVLPFLQGLGYVGPVDVDLRADPRGGGYLLLDVNPRVGGTFRAFVSPEGLDVVRCAYLDLLGQPVPDALVPDGRGWVLETHVTTGLLPYRRDGWLTSRAWIASFRGVEEGGLTAVDDLRPALRAAGHVAVRATERIGRAVGGARRPEEAV